MNPKTSHTPLVLLVRCSGMVFFMIWAGLARGASDPAAAALAPELRSLQTGAGQPLQSIGIPLLIPQTSPLPLLEFNFGFATDETNAPGRFIDSLSVTLQATNGSPTALLLAADINGVSWAPSDPAALTLAADQISRQIATFALANVSYALKFAYSVSLPVPRELTGRAAILYLDLFDNLNALGSVAYVSSVSVRPGQSTNGLSGFALQSSAAADGPYADEPGVERDTARKTLALAQYGRNRFFQLASDSQVRITQFRVDQQNYLFAYEFPAPLVIMQSAATSSGPFADEPRASIDLTNKTIRTPWEGSARFYRVRSNVRARIIATRREGQQLFFRFAYEPSLFRLQSSAQASGPFAFEANAQIDSERQTISLLRGNALRFYRIRSDLPTRITTIRGVNDQWLLSYE